MESKPPIALADLIASLRIHIFPQHKPVSVCVSLLTRFSFVLFVLQVATLSSAVAQTNQAAIRDFGTWKSDPIHSAFFFYKATYVPPPYVVERRGLAVYVNNRLLDPGPEWPAYNYKVERDPGDPPAGVSPFDPPVNGRDVRNGYWPRKWRYLNAQHERKKALQLMFSAYKSSDAVRDVSWHPNADKASGVRVTDIKGRSCVIRLTESLQPWCRPASKEHVLAEAEAAAKDYQMLLSCSNVVFAAPGEQALFGSLRAVELLEILASPEPESRKHQLLQQKDITILDEAFVKTLVAGFRPDDAFVERLRVFRDSVFRPEKKIDLLTLSQFPVVTNMPGAPGGPIPRPLYSAGAWYAMRWVRLSCVCLAVVLVSLSAICVLSIWRCSGKTSTKQQ